MSPSKGRPQRSQNGGRMKRTLRPAVREHDEAVLGRRAFTFAKLADFRVKKSEAGVQPVFGWARRADSFWNLKRRAFLQRQKSEQDEHDGKDKKRRASRHIIFPLPQNQIVASGASAVNAP